MARCASCLVRLSDSYIINILRRYQVFFVCGDSHRRKITSETTFLVRFDQVCLLSDQVASLERSNWYLRFAPGDYSLRDGSIWNYHLGLGENRFASGPIRFQDSLIINMSGRSQFMFFLSHVLINLFLLSDLVGRGPFSTTCWYGELHTRQLSASDDFELLCIKCKIHTTWLVTCFVRRSCCIKKNQNQKCTFITSRVKFWFLPNLQRQWILWISNNFLSTVKWKLNGEDCLW